MYYKTDKLERTGTGFFYEKMAVFHVHGSKVRTRKLWNRKTTL